MYTMKYVPLREKVSLRTINTKKFKSNWLSITFSIPLEKETAALSALVPQVLRRGCARHPDMMALSAALDELYGGAIEPVVRKKGDTLCIGFVTSFLDDVYAPDGSAILEPAVALLSEILNAPATENGVFRADYVESEKQNQINNIRGQMNDKRRYATQRLAQIMCKDEPFGIDRLGTEADVAAITPASLWTQYQALLAQASIEVYYCGSADSARVEQSIDTLLRAIPADTQRVQTDCDVRISANPTPNVVEESMDISQGKLAMGFRTGGVSVWEPEYPALVMLNAIFGGTTMSKLFMNVRERLSLCYYASSTLEKMKGLVMVSSGVEFEKYEQAKTEILAQLDAIRRGEIEDWELEGARRIVVGSCLSTLDSQDRLEDFWLGQASAGLDEDMEALTARLEQVTREEVVAVANRLELDTVYFLKGLEV